MKRLLLALAFVVGTLAEPRVAEAACGSIPYIFQNTSGTNSIVDAATTNANNSFLQACATQVDNTQIGPAGIYPSQVIPSSTATGTFGNGTGQYPFTFGLGTATQVPLSIQGYTGQTADVFDVWNTASRTVKWAWIDSAGVLHLAFAPTGPNGGTFLDTSSTSQTKTGALTTGALTSTGNIAAGTASGTTIAAGPASVLQSTGSTSSNNALNIGFSGTNSGTINWYPNGLSNVAQGSLSASGVLSAAQFSGSGAGLSAGTIPNAALVTAPLDVSATAQTKAGNLTLTPPSGTVAFITNSANATADLADFQVGGVNKAEVMATGSITLTTTAGSVPIIANAGSGTTVDLQDWQVNGANKARIDPTGAGIFSGPVTATQFNGSGAGLTAATVPVTALTGALPTANGGTNQTTWTSGTCVRASSATALASAVGDCVTSVTASGNLTSTGGTTPNISISSSPTFTSVSATGALATTGALNLANDSSSGGQVASEPWIANDGAPIKGININLPTSATYGLRVMVNAGTSLPFQVTPGGDVLVNSTTLGVGHGVSVSGGDLGASRGVESGVVFLGSDGSRFLQSDGVEYVLPHQPLLLNSGYVPPVYNASGAALASTTHIVDTSITGSGTGTNFTITFAGAAIWASATSYACYVGTGPQPSFNSATTTSITATFSVAPGNGTVIPVVCVGS